MLISKATIIFEVFEYRMEHEYGVEINLEPLGFSVAR
jgi:peptide subunit release factor RF-3